MTSIEFNNDTRLSLAGSIAKNGSVEQIERPPESIRIEYKLGEIPRPKLVDFRYRHDVFDRPSMASGVACLTASRVRCMSAGSRHEMMMSAAPTTRHDGRPRAR